MNGIKTELIQSKERKGEKDEEEERKKKKEEVILFEQLIFHNSFELCFQEERKKKRKREKWVSLTFRYMKVKSLAFHLFFLSFYFLSIHLF